jgi:hypothetical protein
LNVLLFKIAGGLIGLALIYSAISYVQGLRNTITNLNKTVAEKNTDIAILRKQIRDMTVAQKDQIDMSEYGVIKVVQGPERIRTIVKTIEAAPLPANCETPALTDEARNML